MLKLFIVLIQIAAFLEYSKCGVTKKPVLMPPELASKIAVAIQKCQPETGIGADTLLLIYEGKYRDDEQFKKFIFCSYKEIGFLRNDGYLNEEKAIRIFKNEPLVEEGIRRCSEEKGSNMVESLFEFYKCFSNTAPVKFTLW